MISNILPYSNLCEGSLIVGTGMSKGWKRVPSKRSSPSLASARRAPFRSTSNTWPGPSAMGMRNAFERCLGLLDQAARMKSSPSTKPLPRRNAAMRPPVPRWLMNETMKASPAGGNWSCGMKVRPGTPRPFTSV